MAGVKGRSGAKTKWKMQNIDAIRSKIQATQIINRLQKHIDGDIEMESTQVTAAVALLKKTVPDIQAVQHSGDPSNPTPIVYQSTIPRKGK